jgi:hypothetical protein
MIVHSGKPVKSQVENEPAADFHTEKSSLMSVTAPDNAGAILATATTPENKQIELRPNLMSNSLLLAQHRLDRIQRRVELASLERADPRTEACQRRLAEVRQHRLHRHRHPLNAGRSFSER